LQSRVVLKENQQEVHRFRNAMGNAALLQITWRFTNHLSSSVAGSRPSSFILELSCVRRNNACPRTALCSSTPAPFSPIRQIRRMKAQLHPRVCTRTHCVLGGSNHVAAHPSTCPRLLSPTLDCSTLPQHRHTQSKGQARRPHTSTQPH
jgi:hypothetical protein